MFKWLHPTVRIVLLLLFGVICIIFPLCILDHEGIRSFIDMLDRHSRDDGLYFLIVYALIWYVPLIIGICIWTFVPLGLLIVHLKNKKKRIGLKRVIDSIKDWGDEVHVFFISKKNSTFLHKHAF
ncbi:MAG: hypothetical protein GQ574_10700 [Crocinitomix sp.]|nr:hypothetical protein [Crocinitomix sp.]